MKKMLCLLVAVGILACSAVPVLAAGTSLDGSANSDAGRISLWAEQRNQSEKCWGGDTPGVEKSTVGTPSSGDMRQGLSVRDMGRDIFDRPKTGGIGSRAVSRAESEGDWEYTFADGEATITGYSGSMDTITTPKTLGGYPVVAIGNSAFSTGTSGLNPADLALRKVTISEGVRTIGEEAFYRCSALEEMALPSTLTVLEDRAMYGCSALSTITLPIGLKKIGQSALKGCETLQSISVPNSVNEIGIGAFSHCLALTKAQLSNKLTVIPSGAFQDCPSLTTISIPTSIKQIDSAAFDECKALTFIDIPESVVDIGENAFQNCSKLQSVEIWNPSVKIATNAFVGSLRLSTIVFHGTKQQWNSVGAGLVDNMRPSTPDSPTFQACIWCVADGQLVATDEPNLALAVGTVSVSPALSDGSVYSGQELTISFTYGGSIPNNATLAAEVRLTGFEGEQNRTLMLSSQNLTGQFTATVQGDYVYNSEDPTIPVGCTAEATVESLGGLPYRMHWTTNVVESPSVTITTQPATGLAAGDPLDVLISGNTIPDNATLSGTVQLTNMSPTSRGSIAFRLTADEPKRTIPCRVADNVTTGTIAASIEAFQLQNQGKTFNFAAEANTSVSVGAGTQPSSSPTEVPPIASQPVDVVPSESRPVDATPSEPQSADTPPAESQPAEGEESPVASQPGNTPPVVSQPGTGSTGGGQSPGVQYPGANSSEPSTPPLVISPPAVDTPSSVVPAVPGASPSQTPGGASQLPASSAEPSTVRPNPIELLPELPTGAPTGLEVIPDADTSTGSALVGPEIGSLWDDTTAGALASWIEDPESGATVQVVTSERDPVPQDQQVATGMIVEVRSADGELLQESTIVVKGDVTGSGEIDLTQLVRLAKAVVGTDPLEGPYALAGDLNEDSEVSLTDLVRLAKMYKDGSLAVDYAVTDGATSELLEETGYELEAWTENMTVMRAGIPENAEIDSIAWTQHDIFEDGREQKLYYEGLEEDIVFGTYDEGQTIITTEVTTKAGKVGTRQTTIDWGSEQITDSPVVNASEEDGVGRSAAAPNVVSRASARPGATRPRPTSKPSASTTNAPSRPTARPSAAASQSAAPSATVSETPTPSYELPATSLLFTFRAQALGANNELREAMKIRPLLRRSNDLSKAAMVRAEEMAAAGVLQHKRPDGSKYDTVVTLGEGTVVGENIHFNKGYATADIAMVAAKGWENSAPHRQQMLEPRYLYTGLGFAQASDGAWYCVQLFSNGDDVLSIDTPKI